jgi:hypothetical protein
MPDPIYVIQTTQPIQVIQDRQVVIVNPVTAATQSNLSDLVFREIPSGTINGVNDTFTTAYNFIPESVQPFVNGVLQTIVNDFQTIGTDTIQFAVSPSSGESIVITYRKA